MDEHKQKDGSMTTQEERELLLRVGRIEGKLDAIINRLDVGSDRMERQEKRIEQCQEKISNAEIKIARHTAVLAIVTAIGSSALVLAIRASIG